MHKGLSNRLYSNIRIMLQVLVYTYKSGLSCLALAQPLRTIARWKVQPLRLKYYQRTGKNEWPKKLVVLSIPVFDAEFHISAISPVHLPPKMLRYTNHIPWFRSPIGTEYDFLYPAFLISLSCLCYSTPNYECHKSQHLYQLLLNHFPPLVIRISELTIPFQIYRPLNIRISESRLPF